MKWFSKKNKKPMIAIIMVLIIIAGLLDIKYKGLFYQILPNSVQSYLSSIF